MNETQELSWADIKEMFAEKSILMLFRKKYIFVPAKKNIICISLA
jgi:hypothetical protein